MTANPLKNNCPDHPRPVCAAGRMRVFLADDQPKVCLALRLLLKQKMKLDVVDQATRTKELLTRIEQVCPDLLLLDWELPGFQAPLLNTLRGRCPHMKIVALSSKPEMGQAALTAGVDAFINKGKPPEQLLTLLRSLDDHVQKIYYTKVKDEL